MLSIAKNPADNATQNFVSPGNKNPGHALAATALLCAAAFGNGCSEPRYSANIIDGAPVAGVIRLNSSGEFDVELGPRSAGM